MEAIFWALMLLAGVVFAAGMGIIFAIEKLVDGLSQLRNNTFYDLPSVLREQTTNICGAIYEASKK